jgi:hypothetical protein
MPQMASRVFLGVVMLIVGLALLFFLRGVLIELILFVLGFLGVLLAFALIGAGLGLIFWSRRRW